MTLVHGGNIYEFASRAGCSPDDILDFSASINPLGPPPGLADHLARVFHRLQHYPDINNRLLTRALAKFHKIAPDRIAVGNGSTELIYWLPRALGVQRALVVQPTFGEYGKAFELHGTPLQKLICGPENGFQPRLEELRAAVEKGSPEAVLLTHPGSPGGSLLDRDLRGWIAEKSREDIVFVIDEVFVDFCEEQSLKELTEGPSNLAIVRSLTKFYGLPGLRIGYLIASRRIADRVRHFVPPWSVNTLAQSAGVYCLEQEEYRSRTLELVAGERRRLAARLAGIKGLRVFPAEANYLLVELDRDLPPAGRLKRDLFDSDRILIRDCGSFEGLDEWYFRVAVRLPDQNERLAGALQNRIGAYSSRPFSSP